MCFSLNSVLISLSPQPRAVTDGPSNLYHVLIVLGQWIGRCLGRDVKAWTSLLGNGDFCQVSVFQELFKSHPKGEKKHSNIKNSIKENLPANL